MPDPHLLRTILATIRQSTGGKRYEALEYMLELGQFDDRQMRELLRLVRDVQDSEKSRLNGQARRMGLPPGILR